MNNMLLSLLLYWLLPQVILGLDELDVDEDLDDTFALLADDQIDAWEAIPLPPPTEAELIRDSDDLDQLHLSDARRMLDKEEQYVMSLGRAHNDRDEEAELEDLEQMLLVDQEGTREVEREPELPLIFNTDDFDDECDDVPGDSPIAPL